MYSTTVDRYLSNQSSAEISELPLPRSEGVDCPADRLEKNFDALLDLLADDRHQLAMEAADD